MKNIHLQPTEDKGRITKHNKELHIEKIAIYNEPSIKMEVFNVYITSDEEIKEGDWFVYKDEVVHRDKGDIDSMWVDAVKNGKKIILTTDQDLIKDGVQSIDDEFLEWFVKNPSCEEVKIESWQTKGEWELDYKIIIPKKEPKQEIVGYRLKPSIDRMMVDGILKNAMPIWNDEDKSVYFIRGHVAGSLVAKMKELQVLDLWFIPIYEDEEIKSDWVKENHLEYYYKEGIMKEEPKQEPLEEVAEKVLANNIDGLRDALQDDDLFLFYKGVIQCYGEAMANYQAKRMYSEEEVIKIVEKSRETGLTAEYLLLTKQFKKK